MYLAGQPLLDAFIRASSDPERAALYRPFSARPHSVPFEVIASADRRPPTVGLTTRIARALAALDPRPRLASEACCPTPCC